MASLPPPSMEPPASSPDAPAPGTLFATLYAELHRLASRQLARLPPNEVLDTTALLHEVYLDMAKRHGLSFPSRGQFMAYAARVMRGLLIEYVRERKAQKRGGQFEITSLRGDEPAPAGGDDGALARLGAALDELAGIEPDLAEIVELKFFCGFSFGEIAALKGMSERTVQRHWEKARIYLHRAFQDAQAA